MFLYIYNFYIPSTLKTQEKVSHAANSEKTVYPPPASAQGATKTATTKKPEQKPADMKYFNCHEAQKMPSPSISWADLKQQDDREISQAKALKDLQKVLQSVLRYPTNDDYNGGYIELDTREKNILKAGLATYHQSNPEHATMLEKGFKNLLSGLETKIISMPEKYILDELVASKGNITKDTLTNILMVMDYHEMQNVAFDVWEAALETYGKTRPSEASRLKRADTVSRAARELRQFGGKMTQETRNKLFDLVKVDKKFPSSND